MTSHYSDTVDFPVRFKRARAATVANLKDLIAITGASVLQQPGAVRPEDVPVARVRTESRQVVSGDVYWAVRSAGCDLAHHCDEAFSRGAVVAVTAHPITAPPDHWVLQTADVQQSLHQWAQWRRQHFSGTLIAIAGGSGRTSARRMIHTVLGSRLRGVSDSIGRDLHIGVPAALGALEPEHDYALLELATISAAEVDALASLAMPKAVVIIAPGHALAANFVEAQAAASAYRKLLAALPSDGRAVLAHDPWLGWVASACSAPITWVGTHDGCDLTAEDMHTVDGQMHFCVGGAKFCISGWGAHHFTAALCATAVARMMGMDFSAIAAALEHYRPVPHGCKVVEMRGAAIINDPSNSDWAGMSQVLEMLRDIDTPGRRILVCGELAEPDAHWPARYWQLGREAVQTAGVHLLIACGRFAKHVAAGARAAGMQPAKAIACRTPQESLPYLGQATQPGDVVLLKGSDLLESQRLAEALGVYPLRRTA